MSIPFKPPDKKLLSRKYAESHALYERLTEEIRFIFEKQLSGQNIKIHTIQYRVKDFDSFFDKIITKKIMNDPFEKINDIAGIRVICLYRRDLEKIGKLISEKLNLIKSDVKTKASRETEFG